MENSYDYSIVVPLYNEEEVFWQLIDRFEKLLCSNDYTINVILVNDGSKDKTPLFIKEVVTKNEKFTGVLLSRNYGHQTAVSAGLDVANGKLGVMVIDGDLQDPPELITEFIKKQEEGYDVVYAVRKQRKENLFKKTGYYLFYRLLKSISKIDLPADSGDFCLMSRRVVDIMNNMPERSRYLRGMRAWIGFKQFPFEYERQKRQAGDAKYDFKMLMNLAYNGIFNFSELPIKLATNLGILGVSISILYSAFIIMQRITNNEIPSGFTTIILAILFFGSLQLITIGILGEYILRIFFQVKARPKYIIDKIINKSE